MSKAEPQQDQEGNRTGPSLCRECEGGVGRPPVCLCFHETGPTGIGFWFQYQAESEPEPIWTRSEPQLELGMLRESSWEPSGQTQGIKTLSSQLLLVAGGGVLVLIQVRSVPGSTCAHSRIPRGNLGTPPGAPEGLTAAAAAHRRDKQRLLCLQARRRGNL